MLNTVEKPQATKFCTVIKLDERKITGSIRPFPKQIFVIRMLMSDPFAVANLLVSFSIRAGLSASVELLVGMRIRIMCLPIADIKK